MKENLNKPFVNLLGCLFQVLTGLSTKLGGTKPFNKSDTNATLSVALKSVAQCLIPNSEDAIRLNSDDIIYMIAVVLNSGLEINQEEISTDINYTNSQLKMNSHCKIETAESFPGYIPDSDSDSSQTELELLQSTTLEKTLMTRVIPEKNIANKDILDLVVHVLVDVEDAKSNLMSLKEGPIILIDGLSRLLALMAEGQNEGNRYNFIIYTPIYSKFSAIFYLQYNAKY